MASGVLPAGLDQYPLVDIASTIALQVIGSCDSASTRSAVRSGSACRTLGTLFHTVGAFLGLRCWFGRLEAAAFFVALALPVFAVVLVFVAIMSLRQVSWCPNTVRRA